VDLANLRQNSGGGLLHQALLCTPRLFNRHGAVRAAGGGPTGRRQEHVLRGAAAVLPQPGCAQLTHRLRPHDAGTCRSVRCTALCVSPHHAPPTLGFARASLSGFALLTARVAAAQGGQWLS
jgi:hypothetical protein